VLWVSIPYSFYPITSSNNTLVLNNGANSVSIPPGYYSTSTFVTTLQNLLQTVDPSFTVTLSSTTAKITISATTAFVINSSGSLTKGLGFVADTAAGLTATATNVLNISGPQYLSVVSKALGEIRSRQSILTPSLVNSIATVPVNTNFGGFIYSEPKIPFQCHLSTTFEITTDVDFALVDDQGAAIDMNGVDWSIALEIKRDFA